MEELENFIPKTLKQHFDKRKRAGSAFSLRLMAKRLKISHSFASQILSGKRRLPSEILDPICEILDIDDISKERMTAAIISRQGWQTPPRPSLHRIEVKTKPHSGQWRQVNHKDFALMRNWYFLAILEATQLSDYDGSVEYLARRLELPVINVSTAVEALTNAGFLIKDEKGYLIKANAVLEFRSRSHQKDLSHYQAQMMEQAQTLMRQKSEPEDLQKRLISSANFTCSREHIPILRSKIAEFLQDIGYEASQQEAEEAYVFGVMFFPLTKQP